MHRKAFSVHQAVVHYNRSIENVNVKTQSKWLSKDDGKLFTHLGTLNP